ncbi:MAG: hypothetical protein ACI4TK_17445, partial [Agathobacter sp.]
RLNFLSLLVFMVIACKANDNDSIIASFIGTHPNSIGLSCLETETLTLSYGEEHLLIVLSLSNPELLMRFIMEGFSIYVDPTHRKKEKYEFKIPGVSAVDLESIKGHSEGHTLEDSLQSRPDIQPLLSYIRQQGVLYSIGKKTGHNDACLLSLKLDTETDRLYYAILVPVSDMMNEKKLNGVWNIGISSDIREEPPGRNGMMPPMPPKDLEGNNRRMEDIMEWLDVSYEELVNISM